MADVIWTSPAFLVLETLPFKVALDLFRKSEMLRKFPEMGGRLPSEKTAYVRYRQLIYRKNYRMIYEYDRDEDTAYVLAVQNCKQKLPTPRDLKRHLPYE